MDETITFEEVNIGDRVSVYTNLYRRRQQLDWVVKAKPLGTGYRGLILKSKGAGDMYLPEKNITKLIRHI